MNTKFRINGMNSIVFIDSEINPQTEKIFDFGAVRPDETGLHSKSVKEFADYVADTEYVCGHNIIDFDLKYINKHGLIEKNADFIDTLYLSPLLFPKKPYHSLLKDDKLQSDSLSNPYNDAVKAKALFFDEVNAFNSLNQDIKQIYYSLLHNDKYFSAFFKYISFKSNIYVLKLIKSTFKNKICDNSPLAEYVLNRPVELAYCLALIWADDKYSITPPWVLNRYPQVEFVMKELRGKPCASKCVYCESTLDVGRKLKEIFGYESFRTYDGEPLQEKAANAAVHNRSLLAVFPTGGGKSVTFQLPALMAGETQRGLTIIISPLQSLMKDQVDNLEKLGIVDAVTINGLLSPIERAEAIERVRNGMASLLYISPESLRSKTIERLLLLRNVVRFVIDEAHCFSSWGQDFRVDYLYIGEFIKILQKKKSNDCKIPVSCFTATAKQKVISDIKNYFGQKLDINLELYATNATRTNLRYAVMHQETEVEKYATLRGLIANKNCPTIVYVSRTRRTIEIARQLEKDGFSARPFNGKMESSEKVANQEDFIGGKVQIIVATSAFGMGVDKKDVGLVVHYDISDSLENYVQEAGRAGRDESINAECYVLFNDNDLDKHFVLLNQTKLSISEIQQVWKAIKDLSKMRPTFCCSSLEIARQAGWDDSVPEVETRVKTAIAALESTGYIKRGQNVPKVYATSIQAHNAADAISIINSCTDMDDERKQNATRIIKSLISSRSIDKADEGEAESRVDYIADILGISKEEVIESVYIMREVGLLADSNDMTAFIYKSDTQKKSLLTLNRHIQLEKFMLSVIDTEKSDYSLKEINERAVEEGIQFSTIKDIRTILNYWKIKGYIKKSNVNADNNTMIYTIVTLEHIEQSIKNREELSGFIFEHLFSKVQDKPFDTEIIPVEFSVLELQIAFSKRISLFKGTEKVSFGDVEDALLYLARIGALGIEGGFMVLYSGMQLTRLIKDNKIRYKKEDYSQLDSFYKQKIQQIHIVGEYAKLMVRNYEKALQFVADYFQMDYRRFISKYFDSSREKEIELNITPAKYKKIFGDLSETQSAIINDLSQYIVVVAGPGSGKTRVLVNKLASLLMLEDVKHEQLLMLTFSRAAATEFKKRLKDLIGNAANYVKIKTFHSYCFDLLGKIGNIEKSDKIVEEAADMILSGEVEPGRVLHSVVVIDEAQDMDKNEYRLICALMRQNEDMRVIAVGDDDQNIFEFRGSSSSYLKKLLEKNKAKKYQMLDNYRSLRNIAELSNYYVSGISMRMKSSPVRSVSKQNGIVRLIKHTDKNLALPVVENFKANNKSGTACILTETNREAMLIIGLLCKNNIKCKLIQSIDGFKLYDLVEIRYFLKALKSGIDSPKIPDNKWNYAKQKLKDSYKNSRCLDAVLMMLDKFEQVNGGKYYSDLEMFIQESNYEDFDSISDQSVVVSTIHKSKGREFDSVYMTLCQPDNNTDEKKRAVYVGMTRAKSELYVHYTGNYFDNLSIPHVKKSIDLKQYGEPDQIGHQLSHTDVYLDYFKNYKKLIFTLRSGTGLFIDGYYLAADTPDGKRRVLRFSKKYIETIDELKSKGYRVKSAEIRFILAWKGEDHDCEIPIILPDLHYIS